MSWIGGEFAIQWQNAISPDVTTRRKALAFWARHREDLPGPIMFRLDDTQLLRGEWERVVRHSEGRCDCGQLRWMLPTRSRPYFPHDQPDLITLGPGKPYLSVTCWGGDTQSTILQLSASEGRLYLRAWPFSHLSREELRQRGVGVAVALDRTHEGERGVETADSHVGLLLTGYAEDLKNASQPWIGLPCDIRESYDRQTGKRTMLRFMPCALYGVDVAASTVTVAIARTCHATNPADRADLHVCP